MARTKIDRMVALKNFVFSLKERYPRDYFYPYDRATIEDIAETNPIGLTMFAHAKQGYGKMTRLSRGMYVIPADWENGNAPWEVKTNTITATA